MNPRDASANEYNYTTGSGMDTFMSRSLDEVSWQNTLGTSFTSLGNLPIGINPTTTTPTNYDASQISGSQSGTTVLGGSSGSGAGSLQIDATNRKIVLSDGSIAVKLGTLPDGTNGLRFEDNTGLGIGQFSRFPDGKVALKIAQPNIEVTQATDSQLTFNSSQDIFKIVAVNTGLAPSITSVLTGTNTYQAIDTNKYPHNLGFTPAVIGFVIVGTSYYALPYTTTYSLGGSGGIGVNTYAISTDANNVLISRNFVDYGPAAGATTVPTVFIKYYLLQESAN